MDKARTQLLKKLNRKRSEYEQALNLLNSDRMVYTDPASGDTGGDDFDDAQREISISHLYTLIERKTRELRNINRLIERINADEHYGLCEECGDPIPAKRLLILPEATLCVSCQRETEKSATLRNRPSRHTRRLERGASVTDDDCDGIDGSGYGVTDLELDMLPTFELEDTDAADSPEKS
jgi:phage/conjugal plasmid C-4 type zinc finger TraR family protein